MKGAIIGDIVGSAFINDKRFTTDFQLLKPISSFTDDTILTFATADAILSNSCFKKTTKKWMSQYPEANYKPEFYSWVQSDTNESFNSIGDGAARRISPAGFLAQSLDHALQLSEESTLVTHNHPNKIKAAKAVAAAIFLAKSGASKQDIKQYIESTFDYNLNHNMEYLRTLEVCKNYESPAPSAITTFLLSKDYEDALRKAISIGGPCSNTVASISGGIAHAFYKHIPKCLVRKALSRITPEMEHFIESFENLYLWNESQNCFLMNVH